MKNFCFHIFSLGLLDDRVIEKKGTPLDTLCHYLAKKLAYGKYRIYLCLLLYHGQHDIDHFQ
jgi:hypothetical protein